MKLQESYCVELKQLIEGLRHHREIRLSEERRRAQELERQNRVREQKEKQRMIQRQRKNWQLIRQHNHAKVSCDKLER